MDESDVIAGCDSRAIFVALLKDYTVVLNKSMLPKISSAKEKAWACLAEQYSKNVGKPNSILKMKKLLNNMKTAVKKKSDVNATGNKPIKLLSWESDFLKLVESKENPVYCKIPGASCVGLGANITSPSTDRNEDNSEAEDDPDDMLAHQQSVTPKLNKKKKLKLSAETEETLNLTTGELQRLLLLEQIKLTRLQAQREQIMIQEMNQRAKQHMEMERDEPEGNVVVVEEDVLKEFLLLK